MSHWNEKEYYIEEYKVGEYYEQLYVHRFINLDKID